MHMILRPLFKFTPQAHHTLGLADLSRRLPSPASGSEPNLVLLLLNAPSHRSSRQSQPLSFPSSFAIWDSCCNLLSSIVATIEGLPPMTGNLQGRDTFLGSATSKASAALTSRRLSFLTVPTPHRSPQSPSMLVNQRPPPWATQLVGRRPFSSFVKPDVPSDHRQHWMIALSHCHLKTVVVHQVLECSRPQIGTQRWCCNSFCQQLLPLCPLVVLEILDTPGLRRPLHNSQLCSMTRSKPHLDFFSILMVGPGQKQGPVSSFFFT